MHPITYNIQRLVNKLLLDSTRDHKDVLAMQALAPLSINKPYVPWSRMAMRASGLMAVLNDIVISGRSTIVECGGGISTLYIGRLLKERGSGHLYTIEHDGEWTEVLRRMLEKEHLCDVVSVTHAPLARTDLAWDKGGLWYSEAALGEIKALTSVDMLLVDGPPAYSKELSHARYPAVPFFRDALAGSYTVVLDDINRRGEQEIVERWESELGISFQRRFVDGSIALGQPEIAFTV